MFKRELSVGLVRLRGHRLLYQTLHPVGQSVGRNCVFHLKQSPGLRSCGLISGFSYGLVFWTWPWPSLFPLIMGTVLAEKLTLWERRDSPGSETGRAALPAPLFVWPALPVTHHPRVSSPPWGEFVGVC